MTNTISYLEGIKGAAKDKQAVVSQRGNHTEVRGVANEVDLADAGIVVDDLQTPEEMWHACYPKCDNTVAVTSLIQIRIDRSKSMAACKITVMEVISLTFHDYAAHFWCTIFIGLLKMNSGISADKNQIWW